MIGTGCRDFDDIVGWFANKKFRFWRLRNVFLYMRERLRRRNSRRSIGILNLYTGKVIDGRLLVNRSGVQLLSLGNFALRDGLTGNRIQFESLQWSSAIRTKRKPFGKSFFTRTAIL